MREAYLTGSNEHFDATDVPTPPVVSLDVDLTKVKVNWKDDTLYAEYSEGEAGGYAEKTALHHRPAHSDLEAAFARVLPHFLLLLEMLPGVQRGEEWLKHDSRQFVRLLEDGEVHTLPELADYAVTGYAYSDKGGVVLLGRKTLRSGKVVNLTSPHEVMDPDPLTGMEYPHLFTLSTELAACDKEVRLYLAGKSAPYVQEQQTDFLAELQDTVDNASGFTSLTISASGKSATIRKKKSGKDAAAGSDD